MPCVSGRDTNLWQGFGKGKNCVSMPRAKKKKVEEVEAADEVANQVTFDTGSAGPEQCAPRPASHALAHARGPTAHQQKQLEDAMLQHAVAARVAKGVRQKAKEQEAQCSLSLRLHDAKMRRLENGEMNMPDSTPKQ